MINIEIFAQKLFNNNVEFITGVPDTLLNDFCIYIEKQWPKDKHVIAANEGNAIALAAGYHLASSTLPLVYMQNSGLGNALNPLLSLTHPNVYSIPLILLIGWRGQPDIKDHVQHKKQGELTPVLLDDMDIPYKILSNNLEESLTAITWAANTAKTTNAPVALIAGKGILEKGEKDDFDESNSNKLSREDAIKCIIECVPKNTIFVATTGRATRELHAIRDLFGEKHDCDFLNVGAMGHTSSIANGIALANKNRLVVCLDGDSAAIMHLGSLTTVGKTSPSSFIHIILNNGVHESVGGQQSAGYMIDFTKIAESSGYVTINHAVEKEDEIKKAIDQLRNEVKPAFLDVHIKKGIRKDLPPLKINNLQLKDQFLRANCK